MQKMKWTFILWCVVSALCFWGCAQETQDETVMWELSESQEEIVSDTQMTVEADEIEETESEEESSLIDIDQYDITDEALKACIRENVVLKEGTEVEDIYWLDDEQRCMRVSIRYEQQPEDIWYNHVEDYFFFPREEEIEVLYVDYSNDGSMVREVWAEPDFNAHLEDIDLDGRDDLIIYLGIDGKRFGERYCAYLNTLDGYKYCPSFENIFRYYVDRENKLLVSTIYEDTDDGIVEAKEYYYYNGNFQKLDIPVGTENVSQYLRESVEKYLNMTAQEISEETGVYLDEKDGTLRILSNAAFFPCLLLEDKGIVVVCLSYDVTYTPRYVTVYYDLQNVFLSEYKITEDMNFADIREAMLAAGCAFEEHIEWGREYADVYRDGNLSYTFVSRLEDGFLFRVYVSG